MKKLIASLLIASTAVLSYGMTAKEAIASHDWDTINCYCATNHIHNYDFLFTSNKLDFIECSLIYNNIYKNAKLDNGNTLCYFKCRMLDNADRYNPADVNALPFEYKQTMHDYVYAHIKKWYTQPYQKRHDILTNPNAKQHYVFNFIYDVAKMDVQNSTNLTGLVDIAVRCDDVAGNNICKDILYSRATAEFSVQLDLAIIYNDVDKIIDALLKIKDVTAKQASAIIQPINAVDCEYRKADILKALNNINSRCTIKLYDDQKTWEPILAKIRAMIQVRKQ